MVPVVDMMVPVEPLASGALALTVEQGAADELENEVFPLRTICPPSGMGLLLAPMVWKTASPFSTNAPEILSSIEKNPMLYGYIPSNHDCRLMAGQPDARDASKFSIDLMVDNVPFKIVGHCVPPYVSNRQV